MVRKFIYQSIRGGRVTAFKRHFKTESLKHIDFDKVWKLTPEQIELVKQSMDYIIPFDATSLYASAMARPVLYPDVSSAELMTDKDWYQIDNDWYTKERMFFVQVDLFIPSDLTYIPLSVKNDKNEAWFVHGDV